MSARQRSARHPRFRTTVVAHRRVAAGTSALARDTAYVHLHAGAALADAVLGVDAVRELDSRRTLVAG
ncbi:hypothetical protein AB2L27_14470 [Kineococcus sp. LSe6-4]|uniref:Uncharacterized protein n=1 Tax=Kineococcus halophytocola TaxID=3234027 RepID=A0ABV4H305_9ACTN